MEILPKEILQQMLEVLSPNLIGKKTGVDGRTIKRFAKNYDIELKRAGYYTTINNSIRWHGKSSQYYKNGKFWFKYLKELGKFNNQ